MQTKIMPTDKVLADAVQKVLFKAAKGKGKATTFLTAYQILDRLPATLRAQLVAERKIGGKGATVRYAAPSIVSDAAEKLPGILIDYIDTRGLRLIIDGKEYEAGNTVCGVYRLPATP